MDFGNVENPGDHNFSLPDDHPETARVLSTQNNAGKPNMYVGCAKWGKKDLKNFYPRGTKNELEYYSSQFNSIELNATFYNIYSADQISNWYELAPDHFRFFPKVNQQVSHYKWLSGVQEATDDFYNSIVHFKEKLGTVFLQLKDNFAPKYFDRVADFIEIWPDEIPLAIEFRHTDWYNDATVADELYNLLEENDMDNIIVDTAGRRDLLHMRLTNNEAFVRYVGANHPTDYDRLDEWTQRIKAWADQGLENIYFFMHQNVERESPKLAAHFITELNKKLNTGLTPPQIPGGNQGTLF